jgi:putative DNA primase/helicase
MNEEFIAAIRAAGMEPKEPIPGKIVRFPGVGRKRGDSGWCRLDEDGQGGVFGDYSTSLKQAWFSRKKLSAEHRARQKDDSLRIRAQREKEREALQAEKAIEARQIVSRYSYGTHPYGQRKRIPDGSYLCDDKKIVLPIFDGDSIVNVQYIFQSGEKRFLGGAKVKGCWIRCAVRPSMDLIICEGWATGVSLGIKHPNMNVIAALFADNLMAVSKWWAKQHRGWQIIIAADTDRETQGNPGLTKAMAAADAIGAKCFAPPFRANEKGTDWNDYYLLRNRLQ